MKQFKDYPLNEWMEAADGCKQCGSKNKVMVTFVDESGNFGDITIQYPHEKICQSQWDDQYAPDVNSGGWEFSHEVFEFARKEFPTLKGRINVAVCMNCWKFITEIPIILFGEKRNFEVDFCESCAKELGILDQLLSGLQS